MVVYSCASITFPVLAKYALKTHKALKPKRLYKEVPGLVDGLKQRSLKNKTFLKAYGQVLARSGK